MPSGQQRPGQPGHSQDMGNTMSRGQGKRASELLYPCKKSLRWNSGCIGVLIGFEFLSKPNF